MMGANQRKNGLTPAVQGGFIVARPSLKVYDAIVAVMQKGHWGGKYGSGWEGTGVGHWWGGNTIQGVLPYFFGRSPRGTRPCRVSWAGLGRSLPRTIPFFWPRTMHVAATPASPTLRRR